MGSGGPIVLARNAKEAGIAIRDLDLVDAITVDTRQGVEQLAQVDLEDRPIYLVQGWWLGIRHHEIAKWLDAHKKPVDQGEIVKLVAGN